MKWITVNTYSPVEMSYSSPGKDMTILYLQ